MLARIRHLLTRGGFAGPRYPGVRGKLLFAWESAVWRRELVYVLRAEDFDPDLMPLPRGVQFHWVTSAADAEPFRDMIAPRLRQTWDSWLRPLSWGELAVVGTAEGQFASYNWVQVGTPKGLPTYYCRMFEDEARILRGRVEPEFRRRGINSAMKHWIFRELFGNRGIRRIRAECYARNIPSVRTLEGLGFIRIGEIAVVSLPLARNYIKWTSAGA